MAGARHEGTIKEMVVRAQEELRHAVIVAERIAFVGGVPSPSVERSAGDGDSMVMLNQDLRGEDNAIARYKDRIAQAEPPGEYGSRRVVEEIPMQDEEHERDLQTALGR